MRTDQSPGAGRARVVLHTDFQRGEIDRRLFGSFVEHMGRCVYSGIFEPAHPTADEFGFRTDVADLIRELGTTVVRYPGGNFVSGYDWRDGIGPIGERPHRLDLAWRSLETNRVGTDEFLPWAARLGLEPMMAVNLGTGGVREAAALVEYCNLPAGTETADLRRKNGQQDPYAVRTWCLGNEMDGAWQIGHQDATGYGKLAAEAAKAMRLVDPSIELVACGSSNAEMATFGSWETTVLEHTADVVDLLSMHAYYDGQQGTDDFCASGWRMSAFIDNVVATIDAVAARRGSRRRIDISFDEWNVWSSSPEVSRERRTEIATEPMITEDPYQALDAVVLGDLLISLINHADRVRIGCLSLLVNVSAPILAERGGAATRQTIFHPMATTAALAVGHSLVPQVTAPTMTSPAYGELPALGAAASHDDSRLAVFLVNRSADPLEVEVVVAEHPEATLVATHHLAASADARPVERGEEAAAPTPLATWQGQYGTTVLSLPARSWTAVELRIAEGSA